MFWSRVVDESVVDNFPQTTTESSHDSPFCPSSSFYVRSIYGVLTHYRYLTLSSRPFPGKPSSVVTSPKTVRLKLYGRPVVTLCPVRDTLHCPNPDQVFILPGILSTVRTPTLTTCNSVAVDSDPLLCTVILTGKVSSWRVWCCREGRNRLILGFKVQRFISSLQINLML